MPTTEMRAHLPGLACAAESTASNAMMPPSPRFRRAGSIAYLIDMIRISATGHRHHAEVAAASAARHGWRPWPRPQGRNWLGRYPRSDAEGHRWLAAVGREADGLCLQRRTGPGSLRWHAPAGSPRGLDHFPSLRRGVANYHGCCLPEKGDRQTRQILGGLRGLQTRATMASEL